MVVLRCNGELQLQSPKRFAKVGKVYVLGTSATSRPNVDPSCRSRAALVSTEKEGDEFPDFVQAAAPAPDLTPEECLESQRQLARQSNLNGTAGAAAGDAARRGADGGGTTSKFGVSSAMAEPINTVWESDEREAEDAVFQPENFMFLGPGAFTDVSPLNEEEEEAAKRTVVGGIGERVEGAPRGASGSAAAALAKGVSPVGSGESTPVMRKSKPSLSPKPNVVGDPVENTAAIESPPDYETAPVTERTPVVESEVAAALPPVAEADPSPRAAEAPDTAAAHMIDSREMPVEMLGDTMHRPDPVGLVAEMPTEHTPASHIELHPDPVEIADNSILAPIETAKAALAGTAGFPGSNSHIDWGGVRIVQTSERKPPSEVEQILLTGKTTGRETRGTGHEEAGQAVVRPADSHQEERAFQPGRRDPQTKPITPSPALDDPQTEPTVRSPPKLENLRIAREHRGVSSAPSTPVRTQPLYRPYVPGQTVAPHRQAQLPTSEKRQSVSLQREASLAMNMKRGSLAESICECGGTSARRQGEDLAVEFEFGGCAVGVAACQKSWDLSTGCSLAAAAAGLAGSPIIRTISRREI
ncbi:uncharacterized protein UV8b_06739 [Ustilaginoidea virens]|uniref:Uncharacterized protein n=1 Tax=Ustilaginoidea virens TaxID=1159556 RepID=A0A8E5HVW2_USTVR|nr:uncharacterized protein UV8b_06739 [Ustilaginoidea virens]QUC22498.1 hypothetical protein UV8b_06739 [Ustilaginoidea virens]